MNIDIMKESTIEYIENIYAISVTYLKENNDIKLKNLLEEFELIEDKIRECNDINIFNNYNNILKSLIKRIEGIINE